MAACDLISETIPLVVVAVKLLEIDFLSSNNRLRENNIATHSLISV